MPGSSWETIKKIIRGYYAVTGQETPTVEAVAKLAGLHRPVVSMNNNFLRSIGILEVERNKLTSLGTRVALGWATNSDEMVKDALSNTVKLSPGINTLLSIVQARGQLKRGAFKCEAMILAGINEKNRQGQFIKAILDLLQEAGILRVSDDTVAPVNSERGRMHEQSPPVPHQPTGQPPAEPPPAPKEPTGKRISFPLGISRLAYVELPGDWTSKDLPKLVKLLELPLGGDVDS